MEKGEENLDDLMYYVKRVHVHGRHGRSRRQPEAPRFPPETWNVYKLELDGNHRTNNEVEGWYSKFQKLMVVQHPWRFIEVLKYEQQSNEQFITRCLMITLKYGHQLQDNTDKKKSV